MINIFQNPILLDFLLYVMALIYSLFHDISQLVLTGNVYKCSVAISIRYLFSFISESWILLPFILVDSFKSASARTMQISFIL